MTFLSSLLAKKRKKKKEEKMAMDLSHALET